MHMQFPLSFFACNRTQLPLVYMKSLVQFHSIGRVQFSVVVFQHRTAVKAVPLVKGDCLCVVCMHVQVRAGNYGVLSR